MVANEVAAVLSPAAKKCGFKDKGYICYEEDAQESVVLRELLDKTPGQRVSQLCTSPHGELFGAWNIPPVRFRSACMSAAFSNMARSSGEK